jgi:hypothetical protein
VAKVHKIIVDLLSNSFYVIQSVFPECDQGHHPHPAGDEAEKGENRHADCI